MLVSFNPSLIRQAGSVAVEELNITDGQVELWWFVVVQPPDTFL